jgi:thioredoxin reductase (NADPH)
MLMRDGFARESTARVLHAGDFSGELNQLSGGPALVRVVAGPEGCRAVRLDSIHLRSLIVGSADIGELLMRAFILRRVSMLEGNIGPVVIGRSRSADVLRLQAFLARSSYPYIAFDPESERGEQFVRSLDITEDDLPVLICPCGRLLRRPTNEEAGTWLGITPNLDSRITYDVVVVGAGPAGLATAVYAASEGLSVLVVERDGVGGQAGASAPIENYLGFPTGISGLALTGRAANQAQKFGANVAVALNAVSLRVTPSDQSASAHGVVLGNGTCVSARTIVVASGARYRRPEVEGIAELEGAGIHYWASPVEAKLCADEEVALVGAGHSAGQAIGQLDLDSKGYILTGRPVRSGDSTAFPLETIIRRCLRGRRRALRVNQAGRIRGRGGRSGGCANSRPARGGEDAGVQQSRRR